MELKCSKIFCSLLLTGLTFQANWSKEMTLQLFQRSYKQVGNMNSNTPQAVMFLNRHPSIRCRGVLGALAEYTQANLM